MLHSPDSGDVETSALPEKRTKSLEKPCRRPPGRYLPSWPWLRASCWPPSSRCPSARAKTRRCGTSPRSGTLWWSASPRTGLTPDDSDRTMMTPYYGHALEGQPMASGQPFDADAYTVAHKSCRSARSWRWATETSPCGSPSPTAVPTWSNTTWTSPWPRRGRSN